MPPDLQMSPSQSPRPANQDAFASLFLAQLGPTGEPSATGDITGSATPLPRKLVADDQHGDDGALPIAIAIAGIAIPGVLPSPAPAAADAATEVATSADDSLLADSVGLNDSSSSAPATSTAIAPAATTTTSRTAVPPFEDEALAFGFTTPGEGVKAGSTNPEEQATASEAPSTQIPSAAAPQESCEPDTHAQPSANQPQPEGVNASPHEANAIGAATPDQIPTANPQQLSAPTSVSTAAATHVCTTNDLSVSGRRTGNETQHGARADGAVPDQDWLSQPGSARPEAGLPIYHESTNASSGASATNAEHRAASDSRNPDPNDSDTNHTVTRRADLTAPAVAASADPMAPATQQQPNPASPGIATPVSPPVASVPAAAQETMIRPNSHASAAVTNNIPDMPAHSPVNLSRIVDRADASEMHIELRTLEFGSVEVHTVIRDSHVGVSLGSDRGDLRSMLAPDIGNLQANLRQHDLHLEPIHYIDQSVSCNSGAGGDASSRQAFYQPSQLPVSRQEDALVELPSIDLMAEHSDTLNLLA